MKPKVENTIENRLDADTFTLSPFSINWISNGAISGVDAAQVNRNASPSNALLSSAKMETDGGSVRLNSHT
jgi:hypothetical protein